MNNLFQNCNYYLCLLNVKSYTITSVLCYSDLDLEITIHICFSPTLLYLNVFGLLREPALNELKESLQGENLKLM